MHTQALSPVSSTDDQLRLRTENADVATAEPDADNVQKLLSLHDETAVTLTQGAAQFESGNGVKTVIPSSAGSEGQSGIKTSLDLPQCSAPAPNTTVTGTAACTDGAVPSQSVNLGGPSHSAQEVRSVGSTPLLCIFGGSWCETTFVWTVEFTLNISDSAAV